jgi:HEAT repeat protein
VGGKKIMTNPKLKLLYHKDDSIPVLRIAVALKIAGVNLWVDKFDAQTDKEAPVDFDGKLVILSGSHELPKTEADLDTEQATLYFVLLKDFSENLDGTDVIGDFRAVKDEAGFDQEIQNIVEFFTSEAQNLVSPPPGKEESYLLDTIARLETYFANSDFVFVDNRVAKGTLSFSSDDESDDDKAISSIGEAFRLSNLFVISGIGGSGKTTLLQEFGLDLAKERLHHMNDAKLPMMIDFSLEKWDEKETFLDLVRSYWKLDTPPESMMEDIIFLIDSFEDVPEHKKDGFVEWLSDNSDFNIILCGDRNTKVPLGWDRVNVAVDRSLVETITRQFIGNDADDVLSTIYKTRKKDFAPLAHNLNVLRILIRLINDSEDKKGPKTLGMLYRTLTEWLWFRFSGFPGWVELDDIRSKIEALAFEMHHSDLTLNSNQIVDDPAAKALDKAGFLISNNNVLDFRYPFAKQYFAASYLFSMKPKKILGLIEEPSFFFSGRMSTVWDSVFVILTGLAEESSNIIMAIADRDPFLAAKCVGGGISVDQSVVNSFGEFFKRLLDEEEHPSVLSASVEALADLGDISAIPKIINVIKNSSDGGMLSSHGLLDALVKFDSAALPGLIDLIRDPNTDFGTGFAAVMAVKSINDPIVIPDILMLLEEGNPHGRELAMVLDGFDNIPSHSLLNMLESDNVDVRRNAMFTFSKLATLDAVPVLLGLLDDSDIDVRMGSAMSLVHIGPDTIPALLEMVTENNSARAEFIGEIIEQIGENTKPFLIDALSTPDHPRRAFIAQTLAKLSWEDLADIERKLLEGETNERIGASWVLGLLGDVGGEDILIDALESDDKELRMISLSGLSRTENKKAFQAITKLLQNENTDTDEAQQALGTLLSSEHKEIIPGLIEALHYQSLLDALPHIISKLSSFKDDAILPLYNVLIGEHDFLRMIASKALEEIGESARSYLEEARDKDSGLIHLAAMLALGGLDGDRDTALKVVLFNNMITPDARVTALSFLQHETNPERVAILLDALNIDNWDIRYAALELGGELTGDEKEKLVAIAKDDSLLMKRRIAAILGVLSNINPSETGVFLNLLEDEVPALRLAAAIGLEKNMDEAFIPTLRASLNDKNIFVSEVISEALDASGSSVKQSSKKVSVQEEDLVNLFFGGER